MNLNKVELIGNLVRDPAIKELQSGQIIATFALATQHNWRDRKTKELMKAVEYPIKGGVLTPRLLCY